MRAAPLVLLGLLASAPLCAQSAADFGDNCTTASAASRDLCLNIAEGARILLARTPVVLSGGNPVPGTASTLGMRIGSQPRLSLAARVSAARVVLPGLEQGATDRELAFVPTAVTIDLGVGVFGGVTLAPTVGGFGSLDLLASVGHLRIPTGDGLFGKLTSWSGGVRVGLLRESFTAPGISVSAMYRRLGDLGYGEPALANGAAWFRLDEVSGWSARAAVSKRLLGFGLTGGVGRDHFTAEANGRVRDLASPGGVLVLSDTELESTRNTVFANAALTFIILHAVAELGWQNGGRAPTGIPTTGRLEKAGLYGSLAVRVTL